MRFIAIACVAAVCSAACGCRTYYENAKASRQDVMFGTGEIAMQRAADLADSSSHARLGAVELARLKMLRGDFAGSSAVLAPQLEELFDETNEGPILKKGQIAGNILAGTIADDMAIPYELPAFELLFGLQYQAINSLFLGQPGNARVYLRRATAVQEQLKDEKAGPDAGTAAKTSKDDAKNASAASAKITAKIAGVADQVRSTYENAFVWYLMGLYFSHEGESGNADIAYREAERINPAIGQFAKPAAGAGRDVVVVYEDDLVDQQSPIKIPLPFGGTLWSVDFPVYDGPARPPSQIAVECGGAAAGACVPVVNVQALAYRTLKDRIPGVATRNVTRAAVKIAAQQVANHIRTGNGIADLAIKLGVLAFNATCTVTSEADTRGWQTIPEHVQMCRIRVPEGAGGVLLRNVRSGRSCQVALPPGGGKGVTFVWFTDVRGFATASVFSLDGSVKPAWTRTQSIL